MKVAIIGAGGTIAPAIVRDLAESDEAEELLLLDIDEGRAQAVAERHGGSKARAARVDADAEPNADESLAKALEGSDVVVNSASYRINLDAMAACLRAGCHYMDLGGLYWMTELQLELDRQFEREGLLALLGIGSAPGKTNLMAGMAVRELSTDPAAP
jgi:lysine 6-dehydrogenase